MIPVLILSCLLTTTHSFLLDHTNDTVQNGPIVKTDCGSVRGITKDGGHSFRGIPYAVPPLGTKRWTKPIPLRKRDSTCWDNVYDATKFGNQCVQLDYTNDSKVLGNENCLFLNVWTPSLIQRSLPVMVWIHGGSLTSGNGNDQQFSPSEILAVETNVVYVSMNYRLNAFGFMALDILSNASSTGTSGNYGFMDQILALEWVQRNIANFGGDPNQVTVFGQSSGGTSVFALLAAPSATRLFQKAWLMSASPLLNKTASEAAKDNEVFLRNTGCTNIQCLYALDARDIVNAIPWKVYPNWDMRDQTDLPENGYFDGALAVVDGDVLPKAPLEAWESGQGIDVPLLIGSMAQETDFAPATMDLDKWNWTTYEERVRQKLDTFGTSISMAALSMYPSSVETPEYQYTSMSSDVRVSCGTDVFSEKASVHFKSPVYRYVVTARPSAAVKLFGLSFPVRYAFHGLDIVAYFGYLKDILPLKQQDNLFASNIRREALYFVKNGRPISPEWTVFPNKTAIFDSQVTYTKKYAEDKCNFWLKNNFYSYSWVN